MSTEQPQNSRYDQMQGALATVDLVSREVGVVSDGKVLNLVVPVVCQVIMYEERVRLRMLQPGDMVEVLFTWEDGQAVAQSIEVLGPARKSSVQPALDNASSKSTPGHIGTNV